MKIKHLLLLLVPVFLILLNLKILAFDHDFYDYDNKIANENLLNYLENKEELKFNYTERELVHLEDVKGLFDLLNVIIYMIAFIILAILIFNKEKLSDVLMISGGITILIILILSMFNFESLFTRFHELIFTNDYWLLDENTLLIRTYPTGFFYDFSRRLVLNIMITGLILITIGAIRNVYTKYKSGAD